MQRVFTAIGLLLPLAACGTPTPLSIATLVLDIGSYAVTGKTTTDHAVSAVAGEDCVVIRVLEGDPCSSHADYDLAFAVLEPLPEEGQVAQPADLLQAQTAAYGVEDVAAPGAFAQVAFLSDDLAPGVGVAQAPVAILPLGDAEYLSDDLRPDTGRATTQIGNAAGAQTRIDG